MATSSGKMFHRTVSDVGIMCIKEGFQQLGAPQAVPPAQAPIESQAGRGAATVYIGFLTWRMELEEIIQAASWEMQERGEGPPLQPETFVAEKLPEVVLQLQQAIRRRSSLSFFPWLTIF